MRDSIEWGASEWSACFNRKKSVSADGRPLWSGGGGGGGGTRPRPATGLSAFREPSSGLPRAMIERVPALAHLLKSIGQGTMRMGSTRCRARVSKILHREAGGLLGGWPIVGTGSSASNRIAPPSRPSSPMAASPRTRVKRTRSLDGNHDATFSDEVLAAVAGIPRDPPGCGVAIVNEQGSGRANLALTFRGVDELVAACTAEDGPLWRTVAYIMIRTPSGRYGLCWSPGAVGIVPARVAGLWVGRAHDKMVAQRKENTGIRWLKAANDTERLAEKVREAVGRPSHERRVASFSGGIDPTTVHLDDEATVAALREGRERFRRMASASVSASSSSSPSSSYLTTATAPIF